MENYVILEAKPIKDIRGTFYIPAYQRGYRWERTQVKTLLNDLYQCMEANGQEKDYCLQPVVVQKKGVQKKGELKYDLIDGQQRLTTITFCCVMPSRTLKPIMHSRTLNPNLV